MYVLAATKETQGDRDDDYGWTVDGELVFVPTIECRAPGCGSDQGYGFAGGDELADAVDELVTVVLLLGTAVGGGTVVGRSGPRLSVRRAGSCQTP